MLLVHPTLKHSGSERSASREPFVFSTAGNIMHGWLLTLLGMWGIPAMQFLLGNPCFYVLLGDIAAMAGRS